MKKKTADEKSEKPKAAAKPQLEIKLIRHQFTPQECDELGMALARAHQAMGDIAGEFELVKANFKARLAEQESVIGRSSSARLAGFEMRNARCRVAFRPADRVKDYFLEHAEPGSKPVLTEAMTESDHQAALLPDEPRFDAQETIELWKDMVGISAMRVGRLTPEIGGKKAPMWFAALTLEIDGQKLSEDLDSEQPCATKRIDIIRRAAKRAKAWLIETVGLESAEGFYVAIDKAVDAQKEREE